MKFAPAPPAYLHLADEARRQRGLLLERLGFHPRSMPSRTVWSGRTAELLAHQAPDQARAAILIVPAPIKTAYIWDLAPECSAVQRLLSAGLQVYMARWRRPQAGDEAWGLEEYADGAVLGCLQAIRAETRQASVFLAGHSLGGTLAAIFASLHAQRVRGLVALEAPIEFGSGRLEAVLALADARALAAAFGNLPGTLLNWASAHGDPMEFSVGPWLDWAQSMHAAPLRRLHWQVRRWSLDEAPMSRRLFEQVAELLYRRNCFTARRLRVSGRLADPQAIEAPVLAVRDPRSRVVPPASVDAYRSRTGSTDVQFVDYCGDTGVVLQHVGVLVGGRAHTEVWPRIAAWLNRR